MRKRAEQHDKKAALLLLNIGQLLTMRLPSAPGPRRGPALRELGMIPDAAVLCVAGKIVSLGKTRQALNDPWIKKNSRRLTEIDCAGRVVLPGFADSHTHPVFTGPRLLDFEKRVSGATYEEIAEAGGGIRSSMKGVREAAKSELAASLLNTLTTFAAHGTTTVEAKSGYGLSLESELKSLEAIRSAAREWPGTVAPTLLGAHVVPPEFKGCPADYVKLVCDEMIPRTAKRKLATCVDVFCDRGAFSEEQCVQILRAARNHGLAVRAHVSQLTRTSLQRFLSLQPRSLDHLDFVGERDITMLAKSKTIATLVPGANYFLGLHDYPPARELIDPEGARQTLTGAEYRLLLAFVSHPNRVLSRHQLIELTSTRRSELFDRSIDVRVSRLRQLLRDQSRTPHIIKTVYGDGYVLGAAVEVE